MSFIAAYALRRAQDLLRVKLDLGVSFSFLSFHHFFHPFLNSFHPELKEMGDWKSKLVDEITILYHKKLFHILKKQSKNNFRYFPGIINVN